MSSEHLRELLSKYEQIVPLLNTAIDTVTDLNNQLGSAKAEVSKYKHNLDLIKEQIMCEKKLIDAGR